MRLLFAFAFAIASATEAMASQSDNPFGSEAVSDAELSTMRGGIRLPNGLDVAVAVHSQTAIDGRVVLSTVYTVDQGPAALQVFAPPVGSSAPSGAESEADANRAAMAAATLPGGVSVTFDRQSGVVMVAGPVAPTAVAVTVAAKPQTINGLGEGLQPVSVVVDGPAIDTAGGAISVHSLPAGTRIRLEGPGLDVSHIVGNAIGTVIANNGNDRVIDTTTTVALDFSNVSPAMLGSSLFRVESIGIDAVRQLIY